MSSPDNRQTLPGSPPTSAPVPTALRRDGATPRSRAERLRMLLILVVLSLAVTIPTLVVTGLFGHRPGSKPPPPAQPTPEPASGLLVSLQQSAEKLLPPPAPLGPEPITLTVRPANMNARLEKILRQTARFGGTATEGIATSSERHLYIDLPASATTAFRQAVTNKAPADAAPTAIPSPAGEQDHVEIILRPAGDDE